MFSFSRIKTIHVFNVYSTISQSTIITSLIGFNIALTNVDARLKQLCINLVPLLCNFVLTLFQRRALTLYQRCETLKIRCRFLFHFQRRINFFSTLIHNDETTLIRRWNVAWAITYLTQILNKNLFLALTFLFHSDFGIWGVRSRLYTCLKHQTRAKKRHTLFDSRNFKVCGRSHL